MKVYTCSICGFAYNEETAERDGAGVSIPFSQLEADWSCPNCGVNSDYFNAVDDENPSEDLSF